MTHSFAKTPLKAAQAPLAAAIGIHRPSEETEGEEETAGGAVAGEGAGAAREALEERGGDGRMDASESESL